MEIDAWDFKYSSELNVFKLGRSDLSPVVGFSSSSGNVWKLDSTNLKFRRNHVLPFSEVEIGKLWRVDSRWCEVVNIGTEWSSNETSESSCISALFEGHCHCNAIIEQTGKWQSVCSFLCLCGYIDVSLFY